MAADSNTDGPGTPIRQKRTTNFNQIVHKYYAVPIFIMKSHFWGLCIPHTCLVGLTPMQMDPLSMAVPILCIMADNQDVEQVIDLQA